MNDEMNINNNPNNNQNRRTSKIIMSTILLIAIFVLYYNIYKILNIINLIKRAYVILPPIEFEECFLYQRLYGLFAVFLSFLMGIDLILLTIIPFLDYNNSFEDYIKKYGQTFVYFNYLVFGPFTLCSIFLCFKYKNKVMYICVDRNPEKKIFDSRIIAILIFIISLSFGLSFLGSFYFEQNYFSNSIKCKSSGNCIIGNIFWSYAIRRLRNEPNRNNLNEPILNNNDNINRGNQINGQILNNENNIQMSNGENNQIDGIILNDENVGNVGNNK